MTIVAKVDIFYQTKIRCNVSVISEKKTEVHPIISLWQKKKKKKKPPDFKFYLDKLTNTKFPHMM